MVTEHKNPFKAILIGTFWGVGHTTTLFIMGLVVLFLKISIPEKISSSLEGLVGVILVILGFRALKKTKMLFHTHKHKHGEIIHEHLHEKISSSHSHQMSFLVGLVHGLAGSGMLMLLVLSTIHSLLEGISYILLFGLGSILGMSVMSFLIGVPFSFSSNKFPQLEMYLRLLAGILSMIFGLFILINLLKIASVHQKQPPAKVAISIAVKSVS